MCEKAAFQSFNLTLVLRVHQALPCHPAKVPLLLSEKATMKALLLLCAMSILWERLGARATERFLHYKSKRRTM